MRPAFGVVKACALRTHTPAQTIVIRLCNMIALAGVLNCQQVGVLGAEYVYKSLAFHSRWSTLHMHSMKGGKECLNEQALTSMPTSGAVPCHTQQLGRNVPLLGVIDGLYSGICTFTEMCQETGWTVSIVTCEMYITVM